VGSWCGSPRPVTRGELGQLIFDRRRRRFQRPMPADLCQYRGGAEDPKPPDLVARLYFLASAAEIAIEHPERKQLGLIGGLRVGEGVRRLALPDACR
jgi:hypothetical protein